MIEKYYLCELLADVVLNSSLATEGNMQSLDYIAGSNFYGIVAVAIYNDNALGNEEKKRLLHTDAVSFGDATISDGQGVFYFMPYAYFKEKDNVNAEVMLHHQIVGNAKYDGVQFKQERNGFLNDNGQYIKKVKKNFQLKSAYDRANRTSDEGKMFGFEAIESGQIFAFSIIYQSESDIGIIEKHLLGYNKYIGKSKTAQYGRVKISVKNNVESVKTFIENDFALVYAESHLCFFDENGMPTYQPTEKQLGFERGKIDWEKSQIRTFTYSPWNGTRATNTMQRNCIAKGSVFYITNPEPSISKQRIVGEYVNEGLGRIIVNPVFLENSGDELRIKLSEVSYIQDKLQTKYISDSQLLKRLERIKRKKQNEISIAAKVNKTLSGLDNSLLEIPSSQWGAIRSFATNAIDLKDFELKLFKSDIGYLEKGVAYERHWGKSNNTEKLKKILIEGTNTLDNDSKLTYIIKLVSEIAKKVNSKDKKGQR